MPILTNLQVINFQRIIPEFKYIILAGKTDRSGLILTTSPTP
jgi:hypothetical protein